MLEVNLLGLEIKSPIILASGILGVSYSTMKRLIDAGLGAVTTKSIGITPREGYKNPSIVEVYPGTFINSVGLANPGIDYFVSEIKEIKRFKFPLIVSVFGDTDEAYGDVALKAQNAGADAIEINISCPHAEVSSWGSNKDLTYDLIKHLKEIIKIPIFVKLNPNVTDIVEIATAAQDAGADALVAINTLKAMIIDINTMKPILHNKSGGLSGKSIHPIAIKHVYDLFENLDLPIIGCGGIFNWEDAISFFLAGASAIQIGTALYKGLGVISEINNGILRYLKENDFKAISDLTGLAHE